MTPSRTSYYFMEEGNPMVYSVNSFSVGRLRFTLNDIRNRALFPALQFQEFTRLSIESPASLVEVKVLPDQHPPYLTFTFSRFIVSSPFQLPRGADSQALHDLLSPFNNLSIEEFAEDFPLSLTPYGLDDPVRVLLEFGSTSMELLIGNRTATGHYAKLPDAPGVFIVRGMAPAVYTWPFGLIDKFALLVNIDNVDRLLIREGERIISADILGEGENAIFSLNGRKAENRSFRAWFQNVISLRMDAEITGPGAGMPGADEVSIEYLLRTGERIAITLVPFSRDFYALSQEGTMEFLIARNQVRRIFDTIDTVVYED
jgi:hypothetical protein